MRMFMGFLVGILVIVAILAIVYRLPPRLDLEREAAFAAGQGLHGQGLDEVEAYLTAAESRFPRLRKGLGKQVIWADPAVKAKTALSVIYIHGFSASSGELRPLPDLVARALGANLFYARLAGHGLDDPDGLGQATLRDWTADMAEALAIGRVLGDKVVVISTSTGSSLVTWALARPALGRDIAATVFISPNYGLRAFGSFLLTGPFAGPLAHLLIGARRGFEPVNEQNAFNWTTDYPVEALIPMAQAVRLAQHTDVNAIKVPALFVYSPQDNVVSPIATAAVAARWGGPHATFDPGPTGDANNHVIAGDVYSPQTSQPVADHIIAWLTTLPEVR